MKDGGGVLCRRRGTERRRDCQARCSAAQGEHCMNGQMIGVGGILGLSIFSFSSIIDTLRVTWESSCLAPVTHLSPRDLLLYTRPQPWIRWILSRRRCLMKLSFSKVDKPQACPSQEPEQSLPAPNWRAG